jgi:hypothetical protein
MAAALGAFVAPSAHADEWNKRTYLTFSAPVQIPGATLPAGTYTFELADPDASRHIVRVSEKDSNKPVGLFMTIPMDRLEPPSDNLVLFAERPAGAPQAIQVWFYPGDRTGEEFVYPRSQAMKIAKANRKPVLSTADNSNASASESQRMDTMRGAHVGRVDETGKMTDEKPPTRAQSESMPSQSAQRDRSATSTAAATPQADTQPRPTGTSGTTSTTARRELPRTASNLAAIELIGALSLIAGFVTRRIRRIAESRA